ncbi:hypothetical protein RHODOSMS8_03376 [Rhodobiaceae bacterium]|nr:hypothetical protein RHODOSMS8_03376 [Rhodobiaceae bacterium]
MLSALLHRPLVWPILVYYLFGYLVLSLLGLINHEAAPTYLLTIGIAVIVSWYSFDVSSKSTEKKLINQYQSFDLFVLSLILLAVLAALALVDFDQFKLRAGLIREHSILYDIINMNVVAAWIASYLAFNSTRKGMGRLHIVLCIFSVGLAVTIGVLEGRRTVVVLPIAFLFINFVISQPTLGIRGGIWGSVALVFLGFAFFLVTQSRLDGGSSGMDIQVLASRIFWPCLALSHYLNSTYAFNPETLAQTWSLIQANFGVGAYQTATEFFGVEAGYTSRIGQAKINFGIILEALLFSGFPYFLLMLIFLNGLVIICFRVAKRAPMNFHVLILMLFLHGYQMEIPYTAVAILKLTTMSVIIQYAKKSYIQLLLPRIRRARSREER